MAGRGRRQLWAFWPTRDVGSASPSETDRRRVATNLLNLTLAGPRVHRYQKIDHDGAEWLLARNRCWFASRPGNNTGSSIEPA